MKMKTNTQETGRDTHIILECISGFSCAATASLKYASVMIFHIHSTCIQQYLYIYIHIYIYIYLYTDKAK